MLQIKLASFDDLWSSEQSQSPTLIFRKETRTHGE